MGEPTTTDIMPTFRYRDVDAALRWLIDVLGCEEHVLMRAGEGVAHGELRYGTGMMMVASFPDQTGASGKVPELDLGHSATYLINDSDDVVERTWERALAAGAPVVDEFHHAPYGGTSFTVRDPEGNYWTVGSYRPQV